MFRKRLILGRLFITFVLLIWAFIETKSIGTIILFILIYLGSEVCGYALSQHAKMINEIKKRTEKED